MPSFGSGVEVADVFKIPNGIPYLCDFPAPIVSCIYADVAAIQYHDSVASTFGQVARSTAYTFWGPGQPTPPTLSGYLNLGPLYSGYLTGLPVRKVGRTTGETGGNVTQTCVNSSSNQFPTVKVLCSEIAAVYARGGDSGSPVYKANVGVFSRAGILWGSTNGTSMYFSPGTQINAALGGQFYW
jgi:hypothetical protein